MAPKQLTVTAQDQQQFRQLSRQMGGQKTDPAETGETLPGFAVFMVIRLLEQVRLNIDITSLTPGRSAVQGLAGIHTKIRFF